MGLGVGTGVWVQDVAVDTEGTRAAAPSLVSVSRLCVRLCHLAVSPGEGHRLLRCHLILVQQSTVNNNINARVVSHCSFFVNVTCFINKSNPADPGFSET